MKQHWVLTFLRSPFNLFSFPFVFDRMLSHWEEEIECRWFLSTQLGRGTCFWFLIKSHTFHMKCLWEKIHTTFHWIQTRIEKSWSWCWRPHLLVVILFCSLFSINICFEVHPERYRCFFSYLPPSPTFLLGKYLGYMRFGVKAPAAWGQLNLAILYQNSELL